ncbi:2727_t:CDS:2, partial [Dentiscutata erythropus]
TTDVLLAFKPVEDISIDQSFCKCYYPDCEDCEKPCSNEMLYCVRCYFRKPEPEFKVWTSGNYAIDMIIRRTQINNDEIDFYWEWIDPKDLANIQYLADGAISSVYKATWLKGYPRRHNGLRPQRGSAMVALKTLGSFDEATSIIDEFNNKFLSNKIDIETSSEIYGLTFLVQTYQIAIVMDFYEGGSLRNLLQKQEFS